MALDPEGIVTFEAAEKKFTAVFSFRAMKATEAHFDLPFFRAIQSIMPAVAPEDAGDKKKLAAAAAEVRFGDLGKLFEFALLKHHSDLTEAEIEDLIDELGLSRISQIIGTTIAGAMAVGDDDSSSEGPRKKPKG